MARFPNGTPARVIVTDLNGKTTTSLERSLLQASVSANLNQPWTIAAAVRSADLDVRTIFADDGDPYVAQSNRLVYLFLRDGATPPWTCRASGVLMSPQDEGDPDSGVTHFTAFDPWQYLFGRPCFLDGAGTAIGPDGRNFFAIPGSHIVAKLLQDTIASEGVGCFIDAGPTYGGTIHWTGTIEDTPIIDFNVQQGTTLGEAWNQLVATGDPSGGPGGIDIVLEPIYDPGTAAMPTRPGFASQLSIYNLAGTTKPSALMAYARLNRSAAHASRQHDGTPGNFVNVADFHIGQGGNPVPLLGPPPRNAASVAKYQPYWQSQFATDQLFVQAVAAMEQQALTLGKQGKRTFTLVPDPLRAPAPFRDYTIGDRIPLYTSNKLRVGASGYQRVQTINLQVNPDGITSVSELLTTPDWRGDTGT